MQFGEPNTDTFPQLLPPVVAGEGPCVTLFAQVDFHTESNFFTGFSGELADGGLFIVTYERLAIGAQVRVELSLPVDQFLSVEGTVIWKRSPRNGDIAPGVGIRLRSVAERDMVRIREFMCQREPSFVDPELLRGDEREPEALGKPGRSAQTSGAWRDRVAPAAEDVAPELAEGVPVSGQTPTVNDRCGAADAAPASADAAPASKAVAPAVAGSGSESVPPLTEKQKRRGKKKSRGRRRKR